MKTILLLSMLAIGLTLSSCRKERSCTCHTTETIVRTGSGEKTTLNYTSSTITSEKQKKGAFKASSGCFSKVYSFPDSGGNGSSAWSSVTTVDSSCELH